MVQRNNAYLMLSSIAASVSLLSGYACMRINANLDVVAQLPPIVRPALLATLRLFRNNAWCVLLRFRATSYEVASGTS